jgi:4-hydroxy-2-oxoheptanedioate aldolase
MFQAIGTTDVVPMARVAGNDPILIKKFLDAGAMGIVVPMVNSAEEAGRAVKAMKFPPEGVRSAGGGRANLYGSDYQKRANDEIAVIIQIEHIDAVGAAEAILSTPGIDVCFVGPVDLSKSMGCEFGSDEHEKAIAGVLETAKALEVAAGIHCGSAADVNRRIREGFQFVAMGSDVGFLASAARREREQLTRVD